ncbi:hypothetical protein NC651_006632 [Populus alba x Populus x berolinensis]|nr:hypothetical protein NC651_006632 [Populus alba x Populus x berolinensis]
MQCETSPNFATSILCLFDHLLGWSSWAMDP